MIALGVMADLDRDGGTGRWRGFTGGPPSPLDPGSTARRFSELLAVLAPLAEAHRADLLSTKPGRCRSVGAGSRPRPFSHRLWMVLDYEYSGDGLRAVAARHRFSHTALASHRLEIDQLLTANNVLLPGRRSPAKTIADLVDYITGPCPETRRYYDRREVRAKKVERRIREASSRSRKDTGTLLLLRRLADLALEELVEDGIIAQAPARSRRPSLREIARVRLDGDLAPYSLRVGLALARDRDQLTLECIAVALRASPSSVQRYLKIHVYPHRKQIWDQFWADPATQDVPRRRVGPAVVR